MLCIVEFSAPQPLFGMELRSHLERSCRDIASVLEECVAALLEYGLEEEVCQVLVFLTECFSTYLSAVKMSVTVGNF